MQTIIESGKDYREIDEYLMNSGAKKLLLVCDPSISFLRLDEYFRNIEERIGIKVVRFSGFQPNPLYESIVEGVRVFKESGCSLIVAVGGGSAMDVAKCIKLYSNMDDSKNFLYQKIIPNDIGLVAIPTTAGTGSEATRYAVIYYNGVKQSVTDNSCIPSVVFMDSSVLRTLPEYQKKSTMMDALCHSIESYWSVNSTEESKVYSKSAIEMILRTKDSYLANEDDGNRNMLKAANLAGKAINITQTTAAHAMSYKLTSLYGISHGHAVALCLSELFPYMIENLSDCIDPRGKEYLGDVFEKIALSFGVSSPIAASDFFREILASLNLNVPSAKEEDYIVLKSSVNIERLKNNPVRLTDEAIEMLYRRILRKGELV